jgi:hypothetical protein
MRQTVRLARGIGVALAVALTASLSGCATPEYRFVGSDARDVILKLPRDWAPLDTNAALKAEGVDPTTATAWAVFYDAAPKPLVAHATSSTPNDPFLFAQTIPVSAEQRASVTDAQLRELMLPSTPEARDLAMKAKDFAILTDEKVTKPKQHGVHLRYSFKLNGTSEIFDVIALTNPKRTAVHRLVVHCTQKCFDAHPEIDDVVTSLTLKSH